jgi:hypothetical protein
LRTFDGTFIKSPEKSDKISRKKRMGYSLRLRAHYRGARRREAPVGFGGPGSRPRARARHGPGPRPLVGPLVDNCMDNLIDRKISYTWISRIYMDIKQCLSINLDSTGYIKIWWKYMDTQGYKEIYVDIYRNATGYPGQVSQCEFQVLILNWIHSGDNCMNNSKDINCGYIYGRTWILVSMNK